MCSETFSLSHHNLAASCLPSPTPSCLLPPSLPSKYTQLLTVLKMSHNVPASVPWHSLIPVPGTPPPKARGSFSSKKAFLNHFPPSTPCTVWHTLLELAALGNAVIKTSLQVDLPTSCHSSLESSGPWMLRTLCILSYREQAVPVRYCVSFHPVPAWEKLGHLQSRLVISSLSLLPDSNTHFRRS